MPSLRGISENVIAGVVVLAILAVLGWLTSAIDVPVPLWAVAAIAVGTFGIGIWLGRLSSDGEDLAGYQADLIGEAVSALQELVGGELSISFDEFIERGVLSPARFGLSLVSNEEIRLSILALDEDGNEFRMLYEAGHSLGRKEHFSLPRASLAGHALETRKLQWTNDVETDQRWEKHPEASPRRGYGSLASVPIIAANRPVAVLNVVSTEKGAFSLGDLIYIELLGGFLGLAWAVGAGKPPDQGSRLGS